MAGGTFAPGEIKVLPGNYHREVSDTQTTITGAINGIGAGIIRANWGPLNEVVEFDTYTDVGEIYGSGQTEDLITEMFNGGIRSGFFVRIGTGGTAPEITLKDTASEPTNVIKITGRYVGTRAFTATIRASLTNAEQKELIIYDGTAVFAKVSFASGTSEVEALVKAAADLSDFIVTKVADGNGVVAQVAQAAFTAGTNPTVSTAEYSVGLNALEPHDWNCLAVDTEEAAIHTLVSEYLNRIFEAGSYPMACVSETKSVALDIRLSHAAAFNNKMMHYVLNPAYDSAGKLYDGYRNAARIAGYIASVATTTSLTHTPVVGYSSLAETLSVTNRTKAKNSGCIALILNKKKQVVIEQGINTLVTPADDEDEGWKKIRRVKVRYELIQRIMADLDDLKADNDANGRATVISRAYGIYSAMVGENKLLAGGSVYEDPKKTASGDSAWFVVACDDKDSLETTYTTFRFRFAPEE